MTAAFAASPLSRRAFLRSSGLAAGGLVFGGALAGCETTSAPAPASVASTGFPAVVDTATRLDGTRAAALRSQGVRTVFRYYCHLPPSLPEKDLTPEEAEAILGEGLSLAAIFQHYNNCFLTFENRWGREDAEQALRQAEAVGQPEGSAIYFGVDGDWPYQALIDPVLAYFEDVNRVFEGSGLDVGVYSNGCICHTVTERGLASYTWLSGSTAHTGTQAFYNLGRWSLFQNALDIRVSDGASSVAVDTNLASPASGGYFGQFDARGAQTASHGDAETRALLMARRFLVEDADVKEVPYSGAVTLARLRKDRNIRVLSENEGWVQMITQEGGARSGDDAVKGWLPASALKTMDAFPDGTTSYGLCGSSRSPSESMKTQNCAAATSRQR